MGRRSTNFVLLPTLSLALAALPAAVFAQGQPPQPPPGQAAQPPASAAQPAHQMHEMQQPASSGAMSADELNKFARVSIAISSVRDSTQAQLAMVKNKKDIFQKALRDQMATRIDSILKTNQMSAADYEHKNYIVSTDAPTRKSFDELVSKITGVPLPTANLTTVAGGNAGAAAPAIKLPPGAVGVHIGHVIQAFGDTPGMQGLLPVALADAKVAATHAALGAKDPNNLDAMKLHAGHVINAIDPSIVAKGPGSGYGVKKATQGVVTHINLAAKATGASQNVITHANHVSTSAQNVLTRCDEAVQLAQKVQAATSASDAAALMSQLVSVTAQLTAGVDKNGDGRITWEAGEGGLQQADEHMKLMLAGEK